MKVSRVYYWCTTLACMHRVARFSFSVAAAAAPPPFKNPSPLLPLQAYVSHRHPTTFFCLFEKRRGINFSLVAVLSPWLGIYVPIPLGILNGSWSLHCAKRGHIRHHSTGSCASRGGLCGTDWGCSGPSCAVNLGESCIVGWDNIFCQVPVATSFIDLATKFSPLLKYTISSAAS